ncbi:MAG: hypothetical protein IPK88_01710 [Saprospiraceae bacterium]|nr:hypothetical protein [Candidatus Defluviibacterium haderslevense]
MKPFKDMATAIMKFIATLSSKLVYLMNCNTDGCQSTDSTITNHFINALL